MNTDIQEILNNLCNYEPMKPTGYAHALGLGSDKNHALKLLVWSICRFNEYTNLFYNLKENSCFFTSDKQIEKNKRYFIIKCNNYGGYGGGKTFLLPKMGTILLSEKEILLVNSTPTYGSNYAIDEKEKLFQDRFTKKDSCLENYYLDIFIPLKNFYWNHYVLSISRHSLFLSKLEFDQKVTN